MHHCYIVLSSVPALQPDSCSWLTSDLTMMNWHHLVAERNSCCQLLITLVTQQFISIVHCCILTGFMSWELKCHDQQRWNQLEVWLNVLKRFVVFVFRKVFAAWRLFCIYRRCRYGQIICIMVLMDTTWVL